MTEKFFCDQCGACCKNIRRANFAHELDRIDVSAFFVFITDETVFIDNIMRSIEVDNVVIIGVLQHLIHELNIHGFIARRKNRAQTVIQSCFFTDVFILCRGFFLLWVADFWIH